MASSLNMVEIRVQNLCRNANFERNCKSKAFKSFLASVVRSKTSDWDIFGYLDNWLQK